jgi:hypothetical protein
MPRYNIAVVLLLGVGKTVNYFTLPDRRTASSQRGHSFIDTTARWLPSPARVVEKTGAGKVRSPGLSALGGGVVRLRLRLDGDKTVIAGYLYAGGASLKDFVLPVYYVAPATRAGS